jgi:two-component system chemotaxis sensor kinase CheA
MHPARSPVDSTEKDSIQNNKLVAEVTLNKSVLEKTIEELATGVLIADPHDLPAVGRLLDAFNKVVSETGDNELPLLNKIGQAAVSLAEEMLIQDPAEAANTLQVLADTVTAMQTAISRSEEEAAGMVPAGLGLDLSGGGSKSSQADTASQLPAAVDDAILAEFISGQESVIEELERLILEVDSTGLDSEHTSAIKRIIHTLKGESGMLGLNEIQRLCHETETYLESGGCDDMVDKLLSVKDWLNSTFESYTAHGIVPVDASDVLALFTADSGSTEKDAPEPAAVEDEAPAAEADAQEKAPVVAEAPAEEEKAEDAAPQYEAQGINLEDADPGLLQDFIIEARGHLDNADVQLLTIENEPEDKEALNALFRSFHTIKGGAGFLDLLDINKLSHVSEDLLDKARRGGLVLKGAVVDVVFESVDALRRLLDAVEQALTSGSAVEPDGGLGDLFSALQKALTGKKDIEAPVAKVEANKKLGEILVESGRAKPDSVEKALANGNGQARIGETLVRDGEVKAKDVADALRAQKQARENTAREQSVQVKEMIKVDTDRLDKLLDVIGELVIAESIVSQDTDILNNASHKVTRNLRQLHKITRSVQELGMSMRMVAIQPTFQKMARLVRDLARKNGKKVEFVTSGEETELDRSVVEKINDPLIHLVRNSLDHGIEDDQKDRTAAGKREAARVELRAFHRGGNIFIEVADDGRGLDRERILAKAREKGIIEDGSEMSDKEVFHLIFAPGFSTAQKITDVSGRGVGMDVVKRNIEALRGNIELISEPGKGTTVSMQLPLTLAIIEGLIIKVGDERYIVPTLSVIESMRPMASDISTVSGRGEMLKVRGEIMPLFRVSGIFNVEGAERDPGKALVMIVETQGKQVALMVDKLLGQQQVVIKSLGRGLGKVQGISGGAIMPDGRVGLIMDIGEVVKLATQSSGNHKSNAAHVDSEQLVAENA